MSHVVSCTTCVALALGSLLLLAPPAVAAPRAMRGTEIVVIGTVHAPAAHMTADTLLAILDAVRPDAILFEVDTSFVDASGSLRPRYRTMNLEAIAATRYHDHTGVPIAPYDIDGRNEFYQRTRFFERLQELSHAIGALARDGRLPAEAKALLDAVHAFDRVRDAFQDDHAAVINSAACDTAMARKAWYGIRGMARIVALTPELQSFAEFTKLREDEWDRRHAAMFGNIMRYKNGRAGQRIVVLCGFEHRYALRAALAPISSARLREYWAD